MTERDGVFLDGVALSNYRGFGQEVQYIGPFERFNFFIGPNNSGKSSVLNFIANHLTSLVLNPQREKGVVLDRLDARLNSTGSVKMGIAVHKMELERAIEKEVPNIFSDFNYGPLLRKTVERMSQQGLIWLHRSRDNKSMDLIDENIDIKAYLSLGGERAWHMLWERLTRQRGGSLSQNWIPDVINTLKRICPLPNISVSLIPAFRQVTEKGHDFDSWNGRGLIDELARLQNPGVLDRSRLEKFHSINEFLRSVTESSDASIEIPHDREYIIVHMDGKVLPLQSLGTGIHQVVMLASFCTLMEEQVVCMEEPELHLHPLLQRRLIKYLHENTSNQYFIATHSAAIIDSPDASIFRVSNAAGETVVDAVLNSASKFEVCWDLGYRASDLLQTNCIVWVEGPSDRIYLRHWISMQAPELKEGIDYSIMFYGGRLLSHLSADDTVEVDTEISRLIALRQLNRRIAIVIDSDRKTVDADINGTKSRIVRELGEHGGIAWITAGREIENYVSKEVMATALGEVYERFHRQLRTGSYDHVLPYKTSDGKNVHEVDKVRVAKAVCSGDVSLDVLDLRERIEALVAYIRSA